MPGTCRPRHSGIGFLIFYEMMIRIVIVEARVGFAST